MSAQENKAKVRAFFEEALNKGNLAVIDDLSAPNEIGHPQPGDPEGGRGPEGAKEFVTLVRATWSDIQVTVDAQVAEDDLVMNKYTMRGTYKGGDPTIPDSAIGRHVTVTGMSLNRFENGKSVESWNEFDRLTFMRQLGLLPEAERTV